jgi:hypothetical protein
MTQQTSEELQKIIEEMTYLVKHPRIQQKTWVANAKRWLPVLRIAQSQLAGEPLEGQSADPSPPK